MSLLRYFNRLPWGVRPLAVLLFIAWQSYADTNTVPAMPMTASPSHVMDDPADKAFRKLMEKDESVQVEIEKLLTSAETNQAKADAFFQATLNLKIKQHQDDLAKEYEAFIKDNPKYIKAVVAFGSFLYEAGREKDALKQWILARQLDPNQASVWNNLGNYYGHNGPATNAFVHYAKAIELSPTQALYYYNLGKNIHIYQEEATAFYNLKLREVVDKIQALYKKALELEPGNFNIATDLAQSYYSVKLPLTGDSDADKKAAELLANSSIAAWDTALKLASESVDKESIFLHKARIFISIGCFEEAQVNLDKVKDPSLMPTKADLTIRLEKEKSKKR